MKRVYNFIFSILFFWQGSHAFYVTNKVPGLVLKAVRRQGEEQKDYHGKRVFENEVVWFGVLGPVQFDALIGGRKIGFRVFSTVKHKRPPTYREVYHGLGEHDTDWKVGEKKVKIVISRAFDGSIYYNFKLSQ